MQFKMFLNSQQLSLHEQNKHKIKWNKFFCDTISQPYNTQYVYRNTPQFLQFAFHLRKLFILL